MPETKKKTCDSSVHLPSENCGSFWSRTLNLFGSRKRVHLESRAEVGCLVEIIQEISRSELVSLRSIVTILAQRY